MTLLFFFAPFSPTSPFIATCFSVSDSMAFDGVDFDEPMEVEALEEKPVIKDEPEPKKAAVAVKVETKGEPEDPVLL